MAINLCKRFFFHKSKKTKLEKLDLRFSKILQTLNINNLKITRTNSINLYANGKFQKSKKDSDLKETT